MEGFYTVAYYMVASGKEDIDFVFILIYLAVESKLSTQDTNGTEDFNCITND